LRIRRFIEEANIDVIADAPAGREALSLAGGEVAATGGTIGPHETL
jgi:hypothetical protein